MEKLEKLYARLRATAVFRGVLTYPVFSLFENYCKAEKGVEKKDAYAAFTAEIYRHGGNLTELVKSLLFTDENAYVKSVAKGEKPLKCIVDSARRELAVFSDFAALKSADFASDMEESIKEIPLFDSVNASLGALYEERLKNISKFGYGIFSGFGTFRFREGKGIEPIISADKIRLSHFIGYEEEREKIVENTRAWLEGKPVLNALLCGDAGSGKSSTVKAVANEFFDEGVRLIEIRKDQLRSLPEVMEKITDNPLKFIIFIDDLSFERSDDDFGVLKAILEGSASVTAKNAVIYATSNRRHLVKERFSDREGDDVHRNDTMQETVSLSERFGLVVRFSKPNKTLYLEIVKALAKRYGVVMEEEELALRAEEFALRKGNRSARSAEQFVNAIRAQSKEL